MKTKIHGAIWVLFILTCTRLTVYSQTTTIICAGQKGIQYHVSGDAGSTFHWMVEGGQIISEPHGNTITVNWGQIPGLYNIEVKEEKSTGCIGNTKKMKVGLQPAPIIQMGGTKNICQGDVAVLNKNEGQHSNQNSYLWQDGITSESYLAKKSGIYWVEITGQNGCKTRDSLTLTVNPLPKIDLGNDTMICASNEIILDAGNTGNLFYWKDGSIAQTRIAHENDGEIWVHVTDGFGCIGSDTILILRCTAQRPLTIPKVFLPKKGGLQNYWIISGSETLANISISIYDRWGILVFVSNKGYTIPWDGTLRGKELPMDAYYYIINPGDGSKNIVGSVTIIK